MTDDRTLDRLIHRSLGHCTHDETLMLSKVKTCAKCQCRIPKAPAIPDYSANPFALVKLMPEGRINWWVNSIGQTIFHVVVTKGGLHEASSQELGRAARECFAKSRNLI